MRLTVVGNAVVYFTRLSREQQDSATKSTDSIGERGAAEKVVDFSAARARAAHQTGRNHQWRK